MADRNFNQDNQSHQDWERDENRYNQQDKRNYGGDNRNYQQRGASQNYRNAGYGNDSAHGFEANDQGPYNRVNYIPDNDDNRNQGNAHYGNYGGQGSGDSNSGYRHEQRIGGYGNAGSGYGQSSRGHQGNYGQQSNWNPQNDQSHGGNNWGNQHSRQDWGRGNVNSGYGDQSRNLGNRGYYNTGNNNDRDWSLNRHGIKNTYGDTHRHDTDNNWWDKTKDKVSSWFGADDHNDQRDRNRDYTGNHRGKGPSNYRRSTDRIREDVCDRLTDDDRLDASNIHVQLDDDAVILSGTVNSREEKRRAEDLAESISGVRNVENRLRVGAGGSTINRHDYTGTTDDVSGIGHESGTTNEIIRNVANDKNATTDKTRNRDI